MAASFKLATSLATPATGLLETTELATKEHLGERSLLSSAANRFLRSASRRSRSSYDQWADSPSSDSESGSALRRSLPVTSAAFSVGKPKQLRPSPSSASSAIALDQIRISNGNRYTSEKPSILVIGLSVHTAPVELREKLAIPEHEWPRAIHALCACPHIEEAAVLSTCNRMEIYVVARSWHMGIREVTQWMSKSSGVPVDDLRPHLFILRQRDATHHLLRVASGLDSLVLGEGQILAQVRQVFKVSQGEVGFGRNLHGLFKQAIEAGKRVRTETSIASGAVSVSSAAVELTAMKLPRNGLRDARVMIVGAGKMSRLLVKHLLSKGCDKMVVVNRTEARVETLREEFPAAQLVYRPFSELVEAAGEADVVFTSTASEELLFHRENVQGLPLAGELTAGVRHFVDISVPRNVGACVGNVGHARVYNVDDLKEVVAANKEDRKRKALEAQVIIEEEIQAFEAWRDSLESVPTIKKLREKIECIRQAEMNRVLAKLGQDVTPKQRKLLEEMSRGMMNKILHGPMTHLRCDGGDARTVQEILENVNAIGRMFDLAADEIMIPQLAAAGRQQ
ncbi:hypothetical protein CLOM_g19064 [Closterium sp. NIES-68]|nr:hypothetical protein CLOM_g19064 [Closterium sp. NIES-68]GJP62345.1 hypothetical protein CLOP_g19423 [Closterium sp. NIES-67]